MSTPCFKKILFLIFAAVLILPIGIARASDEGELVKSGDNSAVYFVKDNIKHVFPHTAVYLSWGYSKDYSTVKIISKDLLDSYVDGEAVKFRTGYMFRGMTKSLFGKEAEAVFIADSGKIRPIYSATVYQTLFDDPKWNLVSWIPDDFLSKFNYELGETVLSDNLHPNGTLVKYNEEPDEIYLIQDGKKQLVSNEVLAQNRFNSERVVKLSEAKFNYSDGTALTIKDANWSEPFVSAVAPVPAPAPTPEPAPAPAPESTPAPIPRDTTVYDSYSQKHITSINYPKDWVLSTNFNNNQRRYEIYFENPLADVTSEGKILKASAVIIFEGDTWNQATVEDYRKVLKRVSFFSEITFDDLTLLDLKNDVANDLGLKEKVAEFLTEKSGRGIKMKVYDFTSNDEEIYLIETALTSTWNNYENIFNKFVTSFKPNTNKGFSDLSDLEVIGWGFADNKTANFGGIVTPYIDIKNVGDVAIDLRNTAKCKLTVTFPSPSGASNLVQEIFIRDGDSFSSGETLRLQFSGIVLEYIGDYEFAFAVNSNSAFQEATLDNNYNTGRKITVSN